MAIRFELILLVTSMYFFFVVKGCGPLPAGQGKIEKPLSELFRMFLDGRSIRFTLSGFHLPPIMVYSDNPADKIKAPTISTTKNGAETSVRNLIMQSVQDVLYEQGRSAFLADYLIDSILQQLDIQVSFDPLKCDKVIDTSGAGALDKMKVNCVLTGDTITSTCMYMNQPNMCDLAQHMGNYKSIDSKHTTVSGSLTTTNAIMANWSNQMWESVLNRVLRSITSRPNGMYFNGASIKLN